MPTSLIRQFVDRPVSVGRCHTVCAVQVREHLVEVDVDVAVEVDELDGVEDRASSRRGRVEQLVHRVVDAVVRLARFQDRRVDRVGIELASRERVGEARLEQLPAREAGDDRSGAPCSPGAGSC